MNLLRSEKRAVVAHHAIIFKMFKAELWKPVVLTVVVEKILPDSVGPAAFDVLAVDRFDYVRLVPYEDGDMGFGYYLVQSIGHNLREIAAITAGVNVA